MFTTSRARASDPAREDLPSRRASPPPRAHLETAIRLASTPEVHFRASRPPPPRAPGRTMRDDALESADESFGESPAGISGVADDAGRDGATGTSGPSSRRSPSSCACSSRMTTRSSTRLAPREETPASCARSSARTWRTTRAPPRRCAARNCDWCDGERLVRGREKIATLLTKEWGEQSDRVQRTKVFTSGHNRVATCFEREQVARASPGTSPGTRIRERRRPTALLRRRATTNARAAKNANRDVSKKFALRRPRRRVLGLRRRWLRARARRYHHPNAGQRYVARGCDRGIELVASDETIGGVFVVVCYVLAWVFFNRLFTLCETFFSPPPPPPAAPRRLAPRSSPRTPSSSAHRNVFSSASPSRSSF